MLITNHVLSGAVIGAVSGEPRRALAVGFVSHFVLDSFPHFGVDDEHLMRIAVPDGLLGLAAIATIARATPRSLLVPVLAGIMGACLPDLDKPGQQFFHRSPFPRWFDSFHSRIQDERSHRMPVELATAAVSTALLAVLLRPRRVPALRTAPSTDARESPARRRWW